MPSQLLQDQYVYLGKESRSREQKLVRPGRLGLDDECVQQVTEALQKQQRENNNNNSSNTDIRDRVECWNKRTRGLYMLHKLRRNVIISFEEYSFSNRPGYRDPDLTWFKTMHDVLSQDWNLLVVAVYRRYGEWALSSIKQLHSRSCFGKYIAAKSGSVEEAPHLWPHQGGRRCISIWPTMQRYLNLKSYLAVSYHNCTYYNQNY